ncbi:Lactonase, 7-bladed beta-propeller-domain-containing protein [Amylocarpus encephaloides]|uniref:Lactonase, 7-bladed beta-propeller-domain-containing protein n=1 Tax=Amylocarpus encephaloides TaxID=45428 RepID=A0A9P7YH74_9HELO|nr:Lactonase, 7-bladed beta-propeller-domain-containing protein [Amylocarpus encephaloides]
MSLITGTIFAGFALLPTSFAMTSRLLTSHFNGAIFSLSLDTNHPGSNGTLAMTSASGGCGSTPTWLQYYDDTKSLYCWDESWQGYGTMAEYSVSTDGILTVAGQAKTTGNDVHGVLYGGPKGRSFIATVQYTPSTLTTYALPLKAGPDPPYTVPLQIETFTIASHGPNERQDRPHPHQVLPDPTGKFILVPDLGADAIHIFSINPTSGFLTACPDAQTAPGDGPRHGEWWSLTGNAMSSEGLKLYTVNELANSVSSWSVTYGAECLSLNKTQTISTFAGGIVPAATVYNGASFPPKAAELRIVGNFLYAANRNDKLFGEQTDSLATYTIDSTTGTLNWVEATSAHAFYPRSFSVNKAGTMIAVGGQTSSTVSIIARDVVTGKLGELIASIQVAGKGTYTNEDGLSSVVWIE